MTLHILLQCTKSKAMVPKSNLVWSENTDLVDWKAHWIETMPKLQSKEMYTGRGFQPTIEFFQHLDDCTCWVVSAGGGLIASSEEI